MNKEFLLLDLAKLLEVDKCFLNDSIYLREEFNWDSLSMISSVISIKNHYAVEVSGSDIYSCETIGDIFHLIEKAQ